MVEIKAGMELDRKIAEALGCKILGGPDWYWCGCNQDHTVHGVAGVGGLGSMPPRLHYYSMDLNAAFAAAEEIGLWREYAYCRAAGQHVISKTVPVVSWHDTIAHDSTPALAICAAILKLKEDEE